MWTEPLYFAKCLNGQEENNNRLLANPGEDALKQTTRDWLIKC